MITYSVPSTHISPQLRNFLFEGTYRVREVNPVYECGWIFVSNEVDIDKAIEIQNKFESMKNGHFYHIVPIYKFSIN